MNYQAVIGLEVHAELQTQSKMFCGCRVVDSTTAEPNRYTCPVCAGMPGALPVANQRAVQLALMVALVLKCKVAAESIFARKNYFYPDLPKGYQISQYERPLATDGHISISTADTERKICIRRVHLEEDTGKLLH
ncbi:MAG: Asp-tRNA(Asn)/Glu-tRNA(Gln) amidotransferase GatCAB subunit B, partial [Anaerolineales bacterium]|nr:Asp-tRNA(Asn)/Glu-tRNA(Gln) amidotransferase GatCAB subunit B [Anaerolineales bacterium]